MLDRNGKRDALVESLIAEGVSVLIMLLLLVALRKGQDLERLAWRLRQRRRRTADAFELGLPLVQAQVSRWEHGEQ